jgi:hypothetical protein
MSVFMSVCPCAYVPTPIADRQRDILYDEKKDQPFSDCLSRAADLPLFLSLRRRLNIFGVRVRVTLRLAVYRQSVRLGDKRLETHDQHFFN